MSSETDVDHRLEADTRTQGLDTATNENGCRRLWEDLGKTLFADGALFILCFPGSLQQPRMAASVFRYVEGQFTNSGSMDVKGNQRQGAEDTEKVEDR